MTISHEQIKLNVAQAIAEDADIRAYCVENFGRPLQIIVNRYGAEGFPGEAEAPFAFLYSDGENELGAVDEETFDFCIVVGAVDASDSPTKNAVMVRSDSSSGLVVCGIADKVEHVREQIADIVRRSVHGACFRTAMRSESNLCDYPLEWAKLRVNYFEPETLED